jgi:hypothetical protein
MSSGIKFKQGFNCVLVLGLIQSKEVQFFLKKLLNFWNIRGGLRQSVLSWTSAGRRQHVDNSLYLLLEQTVVHMSGKILRRGMNTSQVKNMVNLDRGRDSNTHRRISAIEDHMLLTLCNHYNTHHLIFSLLFFVSKNKRRLMKSHFFCLSVFCPSVCVPQRLTFVGSLMRSPW